MNPTVPAPQRTPLRRVSQGSLFRLSRSGAYPDAPHGLGFLEPALGELLDEVEGLNTNIQGLRNLGDALGTFNESFASWLYVMNMNALAVDWPQAPTEASYKFAGRRAKEDAAAALEAVEAAQATSRACSPEATTINASASAVTEEPGNETMLANTIVASSRVLVKKGKPKLSVKEKKERALLVERVANCLPLEFRGSDPNLRRHIELVIGGLLDREGRGIGIVELVKPPDLSQARVNKCLIALVNRKIVRKDNSTGAVLYHWHGLPG